MADSTFSRIQHDLPHTPDDVIEGWLVPHAQRAGWPPSRTNGWQIILGLDYTFDHLRSLRWTLETTALTPYMLAPRHVSVMIGLFETYVLGRSTMFSAVFDGRTRFQRCCDFLREHGVFPWPVVLERDALGLNVLDGHHRLTAFFFLHGYFKGEYAGVPCGNVRHEQPVWVASVANSIR